MPAAIAIPLITGAIGGATTIAGAKMASSAAKNAAKTQSASADRAMAAQQAGYQQQRQDFNPYLQTGTAALGRLGQTAGTYAGGMPSAAPPPPPQGGNLGQLGMPQGGPISGQGLPQGGPPQLGMGGGPQAGMIRVQAPTGEVAMLSQSQAQAAVAKGARILGPGGPQGALRPGMV